MTNRDGGFSRCVVSRAVYWLLERGLIEKRTMNDARLQDLHNVFRCDGPGEAMNTIRLKSVNTELSTYQVGHTTSVA
jgi:hypothetical protein